jgi:hypothetical protein
MSVALARLHVFPGVRRDSLAASLLTWLVIVAYIAVAKVLLDTFLPDAFADPSQGAALGWLPISLISALGALGVTLSHFTGFPAALARSVSTKQRFVIPAVLGVALALAYIAFDIVSGYSHIAAAQFGEGQQFTNVPSMFLIFTAAAPYVEVLYRLFPIPLLLLAARGRFREPTFWVLAVLTSLIEPLTQDLWALRAGLPILFVLAAVQDFALNFTQAALLRRYGFVAAITVRVLYYLLWHVAYVH